MTDLEKTITSKIGYFYAEKHNLLNDYSNKINEVRKEIQLLGITNIVCRPSFNLQITITLARLGIIIGEKGKNLDDLTKFLSKEMKEQVKIYLIESRLTDYLYSFETVYDPCYEF